MQGGEDLAFFGKLAFLSSLITDFLFAMFRSAKHLHA
jgi:hypothetical protein